MPPVIIGGAIAAAGAIGAAKIASSGAKKAAQTTQQGTTAAIEAQNQAYDKSAAALAPWQQSGLGANSLLQGALGMGGQAASDAAFKNFLNSSNYKFQLGQGLNAVNGGYAGQGVLQSGAAMKGINDYAQNMARSAYGDWTGGLTTLANQGFGAASAQAGVSQNLGNNVANLTTSNANALAGLQLQKANTGASLIGGLGAIGANVAGSVLAPSTSSQNYYGVTPNNAFTGYQFG